MIYLVEHKFWGKSIEEFLDWIKNKSKNVFVFLDTETTGLRTDPYEVQLTQVACTVAKYNYTSNTFKEIDTFNKKIKLTDKTLDLLKSDQSRIKKVLSFNRYGQKGIEFYEEGETLKDLFEFLVQYDNPILVIQNAEFDMKFLNTRNSKIRFKNEIIDTKQIAQLFYLPCLQKLSEENTIYDKKIKEIGTSDRDSGLISSSLSKIGPALGINMSGYHDALTDTKLAMQMFSKMIEFLKLHSDVDIRKYQAERISTKRK